MSTAVKGVEVNEFSRFIDHTLATPWETFISDIEKTLRSVQGHRSISSSSSMRGSVECMGAEFVAQKVVVGQYCWNIPEKLVRLLNDLQDEPVIFIYPMDVVSDPLLRGSLLSAISIAIRSVADLSIPVFFTLNSLTSDNVEWIGYRPSISYNEFDQRIVSWSKYESLSMTLSKVTDRHPLYFFDGIRKVYQHRITAMGLDGDHRVLDNFVTKITHFYRFDITQWLGSQEKITGRPKHSLIPNLLNRDMDELLRMLLLRKTTFSMEHLSAINVSIEYREAVQHGIIDNESYSTLLPSRQSAQQFQIIPEWKSIDLQQPFTEFETTILPWKSHSIRNLLVFLILATFTKKQADIGYNFENNYTLDEMMQGVHYEDMAELVGQLSVPTQTAFYQKIPTSNIAAAASVSSTGGGNSYGSSRSSSRSMTPIPSMFSIAVNEVVSPKVPPSVPSNPSTGPRMHGQSLSSMSSSASLNATGNNYSSSNNPNADPQQATQAIENDRYFQPILRYLFQTEPSAPLAELLGGKSFGPGMFLDVDLTSPSSSNPQKHPQVMESLLPTPSDGVHIWLEQFAIIAGLIPTKTTNIIRLWQHCLRELQQHYDMQTPVPSFAHIVGVANSTSTGEEDEVLAKRRAYIASERNKPLYARMLWEDVLYQKGIEEDISVTMPHAPTHSLFVPSYLRASTGSNTRRNKEYSSVLLQQLQMVHFCTVVQNESIDSPFANTSNSASTSSVTSSGQSIQHPKSLLRRIPLTEDMLAMQQHLSQKMFNDTSRTFFSNPLLRFQVVLPNIVPHMQAFRSANPLATVKDFYYWYGLDQAPPSLFATIVETQEQASEPEQLPSFSPNTEDNIGKEIPADVVEDVEEDEETGPSSFSDPVAPAYLAAFSPKKDETSIIPPVQDSKLRLEEKLLESLEVIWRLYAVDSSKANDATSPPPVADVSKCQFSADKEMTKVMAALERMSVAGLAEELLYLALCHNWRLLQHSVSSLASEESQRLGKKAMKPLIQLIQELHALLARYPSSTYTRIMRNTFLQSFEALSPKTPSNDVAVGASAAQETMQSSVLPSPPPAASTTASGLSTPIGPLPPLQMPPPNSTGIANNTSGETGSNVTSLISLVICYDKIAEAMTQVEALVYRLLQLEPVRATLQPSSSSSASNSPVKSPSSGTFGRKITVTKSQSSVLSNNNNSLRSNNNKDVSTRWARILRRWLPSSASKRFVSSSPYILREDTEKMQLLQRMKYLTSAAQGQSIAGGVSGSISAHDWHSTDGRELGAPTAKKFELRALLPGSALDFSQEKESRRLVERKRGVIKQSSVLSEGNLDKTAESSTMAQPVKLQFDEDEGQEFKNRDLGQKKKALSLDYINSDGADSDSSVVDKSYESEEEEGGIVNTENQRYSRSLERYDVALTVFCEKQELQAMWEYAEED